MGIMDVELVPEWFAELCREEQDAGDTRTGVDNFTPVGSGGGSES